MTTTAREDLLAMYPLGGLDAANRAIVEAGVDQILAKRDAELETRLRVIHQPIAGDGGPYCTVCTQDEEQPKPIGWWVPFPCPTILAVSPKAQP